mgnify:CR=1 FL=1
MANIEKTVRYNELLNIYQDLLSNTQKDILLAYYVYDLSFGEIASERNISRAAVEDATKKGIAKLDELENKLHLLEKSENIRKKLAKLKENTKNKQDLEIIEDIERSLE